MNSFLQLFLANMRMLYRNKTAVFFSFTVPAVLYIALSVLPLGKIITTQANYSAYVLPGIIAMTIMQSGIYSLAYWLIDLQSRGIIKRLLVTPLKMHELVISLLASRLTVIFLQVIVLTLIGLVFFDATFEGNVFSVLALVTLGGSIFLLVGLLISNYANSYETAAPITAAVGLPLTFLSNVFYPLDILPPVLQTIAKALPITYLSDGLRQSYMGTASFATVGTDLIVLASWLVVLLLFTFWVFKLKS